MNDIISFHFVYIRTIFSICLIFDFKIYTFIATVLTGPRRGKRVIGLSKGYDPMNNLDISYHGNIMENTHFLAEKLVEKLLREDQFICWRNILKIL